VLVDRLVPQDFDQVGTENEEPTAVLVEHLAELGHRRIGMVAGLGGLSTSEERLRGYQVGLGRRGLAFDPALVETGASRIEPGREAVFRLLALPDPPTALVVANNLMTIGAMRALRDAGARVPQDVALTSFDDFDWADLFSPRLTTVAQPCYDLGAEAVRLLLARLADPSRPSQTVRLTPRLMHRDSCGCGEVRNTRIP
jgi:LacI family transcriptional regulator